MTHALIIGALIALVVIVTPYIIHRLAPALIAKIEAEGGLEGSEQ